MNVKKEVFKFSALLAIAIGAGPASASLWQWSQTAANNANSDGAINFSEGMSPSSVNDSARALMAVVAKYRDDISGLIIPTGTATAYSVTTNSGNLPSPPPDGQLLAVTIATTNGAGVTLSADGGTAYPIQSAAGVGVGAGVLVAGSPYTLKYSAANSAWMLRDFYGSPFTVPLGAMLPFTGDTSPNSNFVLPYGQCVSRTTYSAYFAMVGTRYGACDGTTTFALPDWRGRAIAGADDMGGTAASRLTGYTNGTFGGSQSPLLSQNQLPNVSPSFTGTQGTANSQNSNIPVNAATVQATAGGSVPAITGTIVNTLQSTYTPSGSISSINGNVTQAGFQNVQPTGAVNFLLRII